MGSERRRVEPLHPYLDLLRKLVEGVDRHVEPEAEEQIGEIPPQWRGAEHRGLRAEPELRVCRERVTERCEHSRVCRCSAGKALGEAEFELGIEHERLEHADRAPRELEGDEHRTDPLEQKPFVVRLARGIEERFEGGDRIARPDALAEQGLKDA